MMSDAPIARAPVPRPTRQVDTMTTVRERSSWKKNIMSMATEASPRPAATTCRA